MTLQSQRQAHGRFFQLIATAIACMGSINLGFSFGYSSPAIPQLLRQGHLEKNQVSWFGSIITLGAAAGGPLGGFLLRYSGRKMTIIYCSTFFAISWLCILLGGLYGYILLYIGRLVAGVAVGVVSGSASVYISEIAEPDIRGALTSVFQLSATSGVVLVYGLGNVIDWQWLAVFGMSLSLLSLLLMLPLPDTPRYLLSQGDKLGAKHSLCFYRSSGKDIEREFEEIEKAVKLEKMTISSMTVCELLSNKYRRTLIICSIVFVFDQLMGPTPLWFFISTIFEESGYKGPDAIPPLVVSCTAVIGVLVSIPLMDRFGRKLLMIIGGAAVALSSAAMGLHFFIIEKGITLNWLPVASLSLHIFAFYAGLGSPPYALMSESFPVAAQSVGSGVCILVTWVTAFVYSSLFLDLLNLLTPYGTFWSISCVSLLSIIFVVYFVEETKKKSLQEISGRASESIILDNTDL